MIEITRSGGEVGEVCWWCKGHQDKEAFKEALLEAGAYVPELSPSVSGSFWWAALIEHSYWRFDLNSDPLEPSYMVNPPGRSTRGCFAVTEYWEP